MTEKDTVSKSWFCVINNPEENGYIGKPDEITEKIIQEWIIDNPQRSCAVTYCISAEGLKHCHAVFEDTKAMRFSMIKKVYPTMHIEPTKGNKEQAEEYIKKQGKYKEKGEIVVYLGRHGEIKGYQGARKDFEVIENLIEQGKTPNEIMDISFSYRRYEKMIRDAYYDKRKKETPFIRNIDMYWHFGKSGTGKSYEQIKLIEKYGSENVYLVNEYEHPFDKYNGEKIIFMDEFRGQMKYSLFLSIFDKYKVQLPARYSNLYALWNEVHITSVMSPEQVYKEMVKTSIYEDPLGQLMRRLKTIEYHYIKDGNYKKYVVEATEYNNYKQMIREAEEIPF